jgi:hypothetical protein
MALIKCPDCATDVSDAAPACPRCGRPNSLATARATKKAPPKSQNLSGGFVLLVFICMGVWIYFKASGPVATIQQPSGQQTFEQIRSGRLDAYRSAANDIQKSAIFNEANVAMTAYWTSQGTQIKDWDGKLSRVLTSHGGSEVDIEITTATGTVYEQSGILKATPLYSALSPIAEGQDVVFSGHFVEGMHTATEAMNNRPVAHEMSLTEAGSLDAPTYEVELSSVRQTSSN